MCKEQGSETNKIIKKDRLKSHQSEQVSHANSKNNFKSSKQQNESHSQCGYRDSHWNIKSLYHQEFIELTKINSLDLGKQVNLISFIISPLGVTVQISNSQSSCLEYLYHMVFSKILKMKHVLNFNQKGLKKQSFFNFL